MLISLYLPEAVPKALQWNVEENSLNRLKKYMGMWPRESVHPNYALADNYKKYLLMGTGAPLPDSSDVRIFNVVGKAFGVLADCAYIVDFKHNIEFCVTAFIYCNEGDILNSNRYEYDPVGLPFLTELGQILYNEEKMREKRYPFSNADLKELYHR